MATWAKEQLQKKFEEADELHIAPSREDGATYARA